MVRKIAWCIDDAPLRKKDKKTTWADCFRSYLRLGYVIISLPLLNGVSEADDSLEYIKISHIIFGLLMFPFILFFGILICILYYGYQFLEIKVMK